MNAGHSLIELLIATTIVITIGGGMLALFAPAHGIHSAQPEVSDLHQRLRVAVESLRRDLAMAGAGMPNAFATVLPYRSGELRDDPAAGVFYRRDAISVLYVPHTPAQAEIDSGTPVGSTDLDVTTRFNCGPVGRTALCGFDIGTRAVVFDALGAWDAMTVSRVGPSTLTLTRPVGTPAHAYAAPAVVAEVERHTYYLDVDPSANRRQLRHYDGFSTDLPMVDEVIGLEFDYFGDAVPGGDLVLLPASTLQDGPWRPDPAAPDRYDADLLRIRRIRVRLRLQLANPALRATVPDQGFEFDVTPRNLQAGR